MSSAALDPSAARALAGPRDYFDLLKPRVMSLVVFTALVGLVAAPSRPGFALSAVALFCIAVGAGASGALNMWWDADIDAVMKRTARRPVPAGKVAPGEAAAFGIVLSALSVTLLWLATNALAAGLLAFTIFFYAVVYTMWLKRSTPQNIVIGGAAGALPPVVAWAAATGTAPLEAWLMFAIIFVWTPPHFWALSLCVEIDYEKAGVPMLPNVAGRPATRRQIFAYTALLAPLGVAPAFTPIAGPIYGAAAGAAGLGLLWLAWRILTEPGEDGAAKEPARLLFKWSIAYLFFVFAALLVEAVMRANG
ncbi:MAG: heme o synthase [Pseudomonadota bacterium]